MPAYGHGRCRQPGFTAGQRAARQLADAGRRAKHTSVPCAPQLDAAARHDDACAMPPTRIDTPCDGATAPPVRFRTQGRESLTNGHH